MWGGIFFDKNFLFVKELCGDWFVGDCGVVWCGVLRCCILVYGEMVLCWVVWWIVWFLVGVCCFGWVGVWWMDCLLSCVKCCYFFDLLFCIVLFVVVGCWV